MSKSNARIFFENGIRSFSIKLLNIVSSFNVLYSDSTVNSRISYTDSLNKGRIHSSIRQEGSISRSRVSYVFPYLNKIGSKNPIVFANIIFGMPHGTIGPSKMIREIVYGCYNALADLFVNTDKPTDGKFHSMIVYCFHLLYNSSFADSSNFEYWKINRKYFEEEYPGEFYNISFHSENNDLFRFINLKEIRIIGKLKIEFLDKKQIEAKKKQIEVEERQLAFVYIELIKNRIPPGDVYKDDIKSKSESESEDVWFSEVSFYYFTNNLVKQNNDNVWNFEDSQEDFDWERKILSRAGSGTQRQYQALKNYNLFKYVELLPKIKFPIRKVLAWKNQVDDLFNAGFVKRQLYTRSFQFLEWKQLIGKVSKVWEKSIFYFWEDEIVGSFPNKFGVQIPKKEPMIVFIFPKSYKIHGQETSPFSGETPENVIRLRSALLRFYKTLKKINSKWNEKYAESETKNLPSSLARALSQGQFSKYLKMIHNDFKIIENLSRCEKFIKMEKDYMQEFVVPDQVIQLDDLMERDNDGNLSLKSNNYNRVHPIAIVPDQKNKQTGIKIYYLNPIKWKSKKSRIIPHLIKKNEIIRTFTSKCFSLMKQTYNLLNNKGKNEKIPPSLNDNRNMVQYLLKPQNFKKLFSKKFIPRISLSIDLKKIITIIK